MALIVDSEMPVAALREMRQRLDRGRNADVRLLSADDLWRRSNREFSLVKQEYRDELDEAMDRIGGLRFIHLDNVASLLPGIDPNEPLPLEPFNAWLRACRSRGIAVLTSHHSGKSGDQLGTSSGEFFMDYVIRLEKPPGWVAGEGARFRVKFTKARGIGPDDMELVQTFDARLTNTGVWAV